VLALSTVAGLKVVITGFGLEGVASGVAVGLVVGLSVSGTVSAGTVIIVAGSISADTGRVTTSVSVTLQALKRIRREKKGIKRAMLFLLVYEI